MYSQTLDYVQNQTTNGLQTLENLGDNFVILAEQILTAYDNADTGSQRSQYQRIFRAAGHSYFDRVVLQNPSELDPGAEEHITSVVTMISDSEIADNTLRSGWKHNQLGIIVGDNQTIETIRNLV